MAKVNISSRMQKVLKKGRTEARKRVIERGLIQFRADPDMMEQLLKISEHRGIPLGTMLREWLKNCLRQEQEKIKQPKDAVVYELHNQIQQMVKEEVNKALRSYKA